MKRAIIALSASLLFSLNSHSISHSVENGIIVSNDENAVYLNDGSPNAFLYKPQIAFTSAHSHEQWGEGELVLTTSSGRKVKVEKLLISPGYRDRVFTPKDISEGKAIASRLSDFAVLILSEPIPMTKPVELLKPEQVEEVIRNSEPVYSIGYSYFDSSRTRDGRGRQLQAKMISKDSANEIYKKYYENYHPNWGPKGASFELIDVQITHTATDGSGCDGDSGSGYFIKRSDTKIYIGPGGAHSVGVPNCGKPGYFGEYGNAFAIEPVYKHLDLIREAEAIVLEMTKKIELEKAAIAKAQSEAKKSKKTVITCQKGKLKKKITAINPKCPKGYSKVKG